MTTSGSEMAARQSKNQDAGILARRVAELRTEKGWSQRALSDRATLGSGQVHQIEAHPERNPHPGTIRKLASALEVDVAYLTGQSDERRSELKMEEIDAEEFEKVIDSRLSSALATAFSRHEDLRAYQVHDRHAVSLGIMAGAVIMVDCGADARPGDLVVTEGEGGRLACRYFVPPYLFGGDMGDQGYWLVDSRTSIFGPVLAVLTRGNP